MTDLALASVTEQGRHFETGVPVTFRFVRNTEKSPYFGATFGQDIEPAGRFMLHNEDPGEVPRRWETGLVTFENPLVIRLSLDENIYGPLGWKARLRDVYKATGLKLTRKLLAEGYDGIVTVGEYQGVRDTREIVDLTPLKRANGDRFHGPDGELVFDIGVCCGFAWALHEETGLPVYVTTERPAGHTFGFDQGEEVIHAFCLTPEGDALDASGLHGRPRPEPGVEVDADLDSLEPHQSLVVTTRPINSLAELEDLRVGMGDMSAEWLDLAREWIGLHPELFGRWLKRSNPRQIMRRNADVELRDLERRWLATKDRSDLDQYLRALGRAGRLWATTVGAPHSSVIVRLHDTGSKPRRAGRSVLLEIQRYEGKRFDLMDMGPRGSLRHLLEDLRTRYGARSRILELREEWERNKSKSDTNAQWIAMVRPHASEKRKAAEVGWNPRRNDDSEVRELERQHQAGDMAASRRLASAYERLGRLNDAAEVLAHVYASDDSVAPELIRVYKAAGRETEADALARWEAPPEPWQMESHERSEAERKDRERFGLPRLGPEQPLRAEQLPFWWVRVIGRKGQVWETAVFRSEHDLAYMGRSASGFPEGLWAAAWRGIKRLGNEHGQRIIEAPGSLVFVWVSESLRKPRAPESDPRWRHARPRRAASSSQIFKMAKMSPGELGWYVAGTHVIVKGTRQWAPTDLVWLNPYRPRKVIPQSRMNDHAR